MIKDSFKDILKHTHSLSFIADAKLTGNAEKGETQIGAIAEDKSVVMYGTLNNKLDDLDGHVVGLARMAVLQGYLNFPAFNASESKISIKSENRGGNEMPTEIRFNSGSGHTANYRFMGPDAAKDIKIPSFTAPTWNIAIAPTASNLKDLGYFGGILGGFEPTFTVVLNDDGDLEFQIGSGASDRSVVPIAKNVKGKLVNKHSYPLTKVLNILKLGESGQCAMQFSDNGALMITVNSGIGIYDYIIPAVMH
jgi:hypothetical protein